MIEFFQALSDPAIPFLRYALLVGLLASVSLGIVGSYVVTRRITYIAAAISHCVLGGIGAALYLNVAVGWTWCNPMYGALAAAVLSAIDHRPGEPLRPAARRHGHQRRLGGGHGHRTGLLRQDARLRRSDELPVRQYPADLPPRRVAGGGDGRGGRRRSGWASIRSCWPCVSTRSSPSCAACG